MNKQELTHEELLQKEIHRKRLRAQAQKRYRENIKNNTSKTSQKSLEIYKAEKAKYMRDYRANKKKNIVENRAVLEDNITPQKLEEQINKIDKKSDTSEQRIVTPIVKSKIENRIVPMWKKNLPYKPSKKQIKEAKSYSKTTRIVMIKKIEIVFSKVLKKEFTASHRQIAHKVLIGDELRGDLKTFRNLYSFLFDNKLIIFVNMLQNYYPKITSLNTMLIPFINLLARLDDVYDKEYQQLTLISKKLATSYNDERDMNLINNEDDGKLFDFTPEKVKYHIDKFLTSPKDKALAAVYALQPPRRLDFQYMKLSEQDANVLTDTKFNYLIIDGKEPIKFVYNNYKTFKKYGQQVYDVNEDIKPYLKEYIESANLISNMYLFGAIQNNKMENKNFCANLTSVFYKMYGYNISSRFIRQSAATYINNLEKKPTLKFRKEYALRMAHSVIINQQYQKISIDDEE